MISEKPSSVVLATDLVKTYDKLLAVDHINFSIRPGECFGLLGPNGAGKTTTIKMIYGMLPLSGGSLTVLNLDINKHPRKVKSAIGVVPEEINLDIDLDVTENLEIYANYFNIPKLKAADTARDLLQFLGMKAKKSSAIDELSNGMKRRLLLARALINNPSLLILDEPTTGLDPQMRRVIWEKLRILKEAGMTQILTTHYMTEASLLCDRLAIMDYGHIVDTGQPSELISKYNVEDLEEVFLKLTGRKLVPE